MKISYALCYDKIAIILRSKANSLNKQGTLYFDTINGERDIDFIFKSLSGVDLGLFFGYLTPKALRQSLDRNTTINSDFSLSLDRHKYPELTLLRMTIEEGKNTGATLLIHYDFFESPFGPLVIGSTAKGVCYLMFYKDAHEALSGLCSTFPNAHFIQKETHHHRTVKNFVKGNRGESENITLHVKGTSFQWQVWQELLNISSGHLTTYGFIAKQLKKPLAARAVGTAIGSNLIALLIPCHRVLGASGAIGQYRWGTTRKTALIGWEAAQFNVDKLE